jgi:hypothetical protein
VSGTVLGSRNAAGEKRITRGKILNPKGEGRQQSEAGAD